MQAPNLYFFNPTGEMAIANGTHSYQAPKLLQEFEAALSSLPAFFAQKDDVLLCPSEPLRESFIDFWGNFGVTMPQSRLLEEAANDPVFLSQKKNELHPWCWSPAVHHKLAPFKSNCSGAFLQQPNAYWHADFKALYSRETARDILKSIIQENSSNSFLPQEHLPQSCSDLKEIEQLLMRWGKIVLKAPWSSSGRGLQVLRHGKLNSAVEQWTGSIFKQQGFVMVEPLLDKISDLAFQFEIKNGEVYFLGTSFFNTNSNGLYQANLIGQKPDLLAHEEHFLNENKEVIPNLIQKAIAKSPITKKYHGFLGVDAFVYRTEQGLRFQPCVEINLRYNMGTLALQLEKLIHEQARGEFKVYFDPKSNFEDFSHQQQKENPAKAKAGKAYCGFFPVSSTVNTRFGAYLELGQ